MRVWVSAADVRRSMPMASTYETRIKSTWYLDQQAANAREAAGGRNIGAKSEVVGAQYLVGIAVEVAAHARFGVGRRHENAH